MFARPINGTDLWQRDQWSRTFAKNNFDEVGEILSDQMYPDDELIEYIDDIYEIDNTEVGRWFDN